MCEVQPALPGADRRRTLTILRFRDRVVAARLDHALVEHDRARDVFAESPADATAGAGFDEAVLWTCIERVASADELRVQHHIPLLLGAGDQIRESLPGHQVARAC